MAIIVEDGSLVANANSYVTRAEFIAYAQGFGVAIPDTEASDAQLLKAAQFIDSHESRLKGTRSTRDQAMAYPRSDLMIEGYYWAQDEIPRQVLLCQLNVAMDINSGIDPYNPAPPDNRALRREKVDGAVDVEYFGNDKAVKMSRTSSATALLSSLLRNNGLSVALVRA